MKTRHARGGGSTGEGFSQADWNRQTVEPEKGLKRIRQIRICSECRFRNHPSRSTCMGCGGEISAIAPVDRPHEIPVTKLAIKMEQQGMSRNLDGEARLRAVAGWFFWEGILWGILSLVAFVLLNLLTTGIPFLFPLGLLAASVAAPGIGYILCHGLREYGNYARIAGGVLTLLGGLFSCLPLAGFMLAEDGPFLEIAFFNLLLTLHCLATAILLFLPGSARICTGEYRLRARRSPETPESLKSIFFWLPLLRWIYAIGLIVIPIVTFYYSVYF